jgi:hypothetical protein
MNGVPWLLRAGLFFFFFLCNSFIYYFMRIHYCFAIEYAFKAPLSG